MRADRLLAILLRLQARGRGTAAALARELEVSERTIHRDMEALSAAGVPVYAERGARGGWVLPADYRAGPRGLQPDELRALFLGMPGAVLGDLGLDRASESALTKLLLTMTSRDRAELELARKRVLVDTSGWRASTLEATPLLAPVRDAVMRERQVELSYVRADGVAIERVVHPLGLVAQNRLWYLVAATPDGELRSYRVSRVRGVRVTTAPCVVPDGFDLAAYWAASKSRLIAGLPALEVRLRADPEVVPRLRTDGRWSRVESIAAPADDGWREVRMRFELAEDACAFVLSFGPAVELLAPAQLRQQVADLAARTAARYRTSDP